MPREQSAAEPASSKPRWMQTAKGRKFLSEMMRKRRAKERREGKVRARAGRPPKVDGDVYFLAKKVRRLITERLRAGEELNQLFIFAHLLAERVMEGK